MVHVPNVQIMDIIFVLEKRFDYAKAKDNVCKPNRTAE